MPQGWCPFEKRGRQQTRSLRACSEEGPRGDTARRRHPYASKRGFTRNQIPAPWSGTSGLWN